MSVQYDLSNVIGEGITCHLIVHDQQPHVKLQLLLSRERDANSIINDTVNTQFKVIGRHFAQEVTKYLVKTTKNDDRPARKRDFSSSGTQYYDPHHPSCLAHMTDISTLITPVQIPESFEADMQKVLKDAAREGSQVIKAAIRYSEASSTVRGSIRSIRDRSRGDEKPTVGRT